MEAFFSLITHLSLLILLFQAAHSGTVTGNGVADQWRHPSVHYVQESISKYANAHQAHALPQQLCKFTSTHCIFCSWWVLLIFSFSFFLLFYDSLKTCEEGFELREDDMAFSPESSPLAAPAPTPGGVISTSPDYTWPFHYKQVNSPSSSPTNSPPSADADEGMPFINSNPTVPLPTGETDSVTIRPLPISAHQDQVIFYCFFLDIFHLPIDQSCNY